MGDDPMVCEFVGMLVEQAGFKPLLALDASGAVALGEQHRPDLAIADVTLGPATSGLDILCKLKAARDPPVILPSGVSSVDIRVSGLELRVDDANLALKEHASPGRGGPGGSSTGPRCALVEPSLHG